MLALVMAEPALEPTIKPGDTVIMSLTQWQFTPGGIFVANLNGTPLWCQLSQLAPLLTLLGFDIPN